MHLTLPLMPAGGALLVTAAASRALLPLLPPVVPPPILAFAACMAFVNGGVMPASAPAYGLATSAALPLSVGLALMASATPTGRLGHALVPMLQAFLLVSAGSLLGAVVAFGVMTQLRLIPVAQAACSAGCLCATYIGGTANMLAVASATGASRYDGLLPSLLAADAALMGCHFGLLFSAAKWRGAHLALATTVTEESSAADAAVDAEPPPAVEATPGPRPRLLRWGVPAAGAAVAVLASALATRLEASGAVPAGGALALICLVCAGASGAAASALPSAAAALRCLAPPAELLSCVFLGALGAQAQLGTIMVAGPASALMCAITLAIHGAAGAAGALFANRALGARISLPALLVASNAAVGGSSTAAAMALALGWRELIAPGAACGTLGYAAATGLGVALNAMLCRYS